ncbi:MAG: hypothetical protein WC960_04510 [Bacteroidales bacterium]
MKFREFTKGVISLLLLFSYLIGSVGFALHICSSEESIELILFNSGTECNELHQESHLHHSCCSTAHNSQCAEHNSIDSEERESFNCCDTKLFHLIEEAELPFTLGKGTIYSPLQIALLPSFWSRPNSLPSVLPKSLLLSYEDGDAWARDLLDILAHNSQWRL